MTLTLAQIRTQVRAGILDENSTEVPLDATVDSAINRAVRVLARDYNLSQSTVIAYFPDSTSNGSVISKTQTGTVVITYNAFGGWSTYKVSDAIRMIDASRHLSVADGRPQEIREATTAQIDDDGLRYDNSDIITHYTVLKSNDFRLQFYPKLNSDGYPHYVRFSYVSNPPLLSDDDDVPDLPDAYHETIVPIAVAILERDLGRPERQAGAMSIASPEISSARDYEQSRRGRGTPQQISRTRKPLS
jgi:hypothetical protein